MNQTFVYRKHLRASFSSFIKAVLLLILGIAIIAFGLLFTNQKERTVEDTIAIVIVFVIVILIVLILMLLEVGIIYLILLRRFRSISVTLTDDGIVYNNSKKQIIIPYEDVQKLVFPSVKYTGGWIKIVYRGGNIRLTVVLEHIGDFIYELKKKMDDREMSHVYNEKKLISFFKTAVFADESWARIYHNYKLQLVISYICLIMTTVMIRGFNDSSNSKSFIYGALLAPLLGYLISEIIIGLKLKKRLINGELRVSPRVPEFEQKVFNISIMVFSLGYLLLLFFWLIVQ